MTAIISTRSASIRAARAYARLCGHKVARNGWIYDRGGKPLAQGWDAYWKQFGESIQRHAARQSVKVAWREANREV